MRHYSGDLKKYRGSLQIEYSVEQVSRNTISNADKKSKKVQIALRDHVMTSRDVERIFVTKDRDETRSTTIKASPIFDASMFHEKSARHLRSCTYNSTLQSFLIIIMCESAITFLSEFTQPNKVRPTQLHKKKRAQRVQRVPGSKRVKTVRVHS